MVVISVRCVRGQNLVKAEQMFEGVVKPHRRRCAAKQMVMRGEAPPDGARVGLRVTAIGAWDSQIAQRDPLACQHPEQVMVGDDQKFGRVRKAFVLGKPAWLAMAMRADDGKVPDGLVKGSRHVAKPFLDRKQAVRICQGHVIILTALSQREDRRKASSLTSPFCCRERLSVGSGRLHRSGNRQAHLLRHPCASSRR